MDHRGLLASVTAETLAVSGELDPFVSGAHEIAAALPNGTLAIVLDFLARRPFGDSP